MDTDSLIKRFISEYESYIQISNNALLRSQYNQKEIDDLIELGYLLPIKTIDNDVLYSVQIM